MSIIGILTAVIVVLLALVVAVATRPSSFRVERSASIPVPPADLFEYVNDFHRWVSWSPWENIDPNLTRGYSGAASGTGAVYEWSGNNKAGQGRMSIRESHPNEKVVIDLQFTRPFKAENTSMFTFTPTGNRTVVKWEMSGANSTMGKVMALFGGMEKFIGRDFDRGLANLAAVAQSDAEGRRVSRMPQRSG